MQIEQIEAIPPSSDLRVDCLMLTLAVRERLPFAIKSIDCYCRQTLPNKRLLLIINGGIESCHRELRDHVASLGRQDILVYTAPPGLNLGQLRNFSLSVATGDILCQWDDDDLYHPERIARQLALLVEGHFEAVYLQEVMQYFPADQKLHWTNWRATESRAHPGTLMVRREVPIHYPTEGGIAHLGEDTYVANALIARGRVGFLVGLAYLFIYVSHGANSWNEGHHRMLAQELSISQALVRRREAQLREGLAPFSLPSGVVSLVGSNGPAFVL